jgi:hypothetical protein
VIKYEHRMRIKWSLEQDKVAVLTVLMLRGLQTAGEIRTRSGRLHEFKSVAEAESALQFLIDKYPPLVARLERAPGTKEPRYGQLLGGEIDVARDADRPSVRIGAPQAGGRVGQLEQEVAALRARSRRTQGAVRGVPPAVRIAVPVRRRGVRRLGVCRRPARPAPRRSTRHRRSARRNAPSSTFSAMLRSPSRRWPHPDLGAAALKLRSPPRGVLLERRAPVAGQQQLVIRVRHPERNLFLGDSPSSPCIRGAGRPGGEHCPAGPACAHRFGHDPVVAALLVQDQFALASSAASLRGT